MPYFGQCQWFCDGGSMQPNLRLVRRELTSAGIVSQSSVIKWAFCCLRA